jgi:nitrite reductase/ring-hydroxylating ferredoxin subunit
VAVTVRYEPLAAVADLREGFLATHEVAGRPVVVARTATGVHVYDAMCPHSDFQFGAARLRRGCEIECQMHGARFQADETGVVDGVVEVLVDWLM